MLGAAAGETAQAEVAQSEAQVAEARRQLDEFEQYDWSVLLRTQNTGVANVVTFSQMTDRLAISMAALFVVVGLLVSYFAVCRVVHEQVIQIGTKKALGFSAGEITKSYLWYSGAAVLAGVIIGAILAYVAVERIVNDALSSVFAFGSIPTFFGLSLFFGVAVAELVLILGTTYLACRSVLKRNAIDLLQGEAPSVGKQRFYERWRFWSGVPLLIQTELIVLMINGFSLKDAEDYVSYDSIALTALGMIGGCYLGGIVGTITIAVVEPSTGVFLKGADAWAMGIGIVGASILAFVMGKIALRRIRGFELTDINGQ